MSKVELRPLCREDTDKIVSWRNRDDVRFNLYNPNLLTAEQHLWYFDNIVSTGKVQQFIIQVAEDGNVWDIGSTFLKSIDAQCRKAEFGIFIGEPDARGKGYVPQATMEILKFGFEQLGLNRIYLSVFADNAPAIHSYERTGFKLEGVLREDFCRNGEFVDVVLMAMTKADYQKICNTRIAIDFVSC